MSAWQVHLVSAFGRGETLALALQEQGFPVRVLDFTGALSPECRKGAGPFPILLHNFLPQQRFITEEVKRLERGITFWLPEGPLELSGPMAPLFSARPAVQTIAKHGAAADFKQDWLRRFLVQWAGPFHQEPWTAAADEVFPVNAPLGFMSASKERRVLSFERFQALEYPYEACRSLGDVQTEGARITGIEVDAGQPAAFKSVQWIWCLSSHETELLNPEVAAKLFNQKPWRPEWSWISFEGRTERGPWSHGFPEYGVVIGDIHLPWVYANSTILRWTDTDLFHAWIKVPTAAMGQVDQRRQWAADIEKLLDGRLSLAKWKVDAGAWGYCPNSPVFDPAAVERIAPSWKNWDWISPETLPRLDLSARLQREGQSYDRLAQWRNDLVKKQGGSRDQALHAP